MRSANPFRGSRGMASIPSLVLATLAAIGVGFLVVRLADVLLLIFASILLAMLLHAIAQPMRKRLRLNRPSALVAALALVTAAVVLLSWLFGRQMAAQLSSLVVLLPRSWTGMQSHLASSPLGQLVIHGLKGITLPDGSVLTWVTLVAGSVASVAAGLVIAIAAGVYFAFHPETYAGGVLWLVPRRHRDRAREIMEACRLALTRWLIGQVLSMIFIAATTSFGLWLAGVPSPLPLGVIAGFGQFVPVVGPWVAAFPGLVVALAQGPETFGWAFLVYLVTTQVESNFLTPLVLRQMAQVPMAVTMFAVVAMGVLLGPLGVLLATPLAVVAYVLVRKVYLEVILGERLDGAGGSSGSRADAK